MFSPGCERRPSEQKSLASQSSLTSPPLSQRCQVKIAKVKNQNQEMTAQFGFRTAKCYKRNFVSLRIRNIYLKLQNEAN